MICERHQMARKIVRKVMERIITRRLYSEAFGVVVRKVKGKRIEKDIKRVLKM